MTVGVDLDHLAEAVFVRFLHCKLTLSLPLPSIPSSLEGSHSAQPALKEQGAMLPLLEGRVAT